MIEKRFKFRHVNEVTGLFVLGVMLIVVAGLVFSGHSQGWFARKYALNVLLPESGTSGLRRGDEVFILGVAVGLVNDISVDVEGRMTAEVKIRRDFERFVRTDSTAVIRKAFAVAGDSFMEITRGTGAALPPRSPTIRCVPSEDALGRMEKMLASLSAELVPVVRKAGNGFDEWTRLGADLQKNSAQIAGLFTRLDKLAAGLEEGKGTAGKLLMETTLADDAEKLLAEARQAMRQVQVIATNLNAAVQNVQKGAARLPEIADAVAGETKDLPGLVEQTQSSMRELERLIEALQRHWLVRKYMKPANASDPRLSAEDGQEARKNFQPVKSPKGASSTMEKP